MKRLGSAQHTGPVAPMGEFTAPTVAGGGCCWGWFPGARRSGNQIGHQRRGCCVGGGGVTAVQVHSGCHSALATGPPWPQDSEGHLGVRIPLVCALCASTLRWGRGEEAQLPPCEVTPWLRSRHQGLWRGPSFPSPWPPSHLYGQVLLRPLPPTDPPAHCGVSSLGQRCWTLRVSFWVWAGCRGVSASVASQPDPRC